MSASLVGSEMCIRDRSRPAWRRAHPSHVPHGPPVDGPECPRLGAQCTTCLLYTSDAADDM
eukprot:5189319-Alexandrium_andersonii.AAC.1